MTKIQISNFIVIRITDKADGQTVERVEENTQTWSHKAKLVHTGYSRLCYQMYSGMLIAIVTIFILSSMLWSE